MEQMNLQTDKESPRDIALEGIEEAKVYIKKLIGGVETTTDMYRAGEFAKANATYSDCINGLNWFISLLVYVEKLFNVDYEKTFGDNWPNCNYSARFPVMFKEIINCQKNKDWTGMADVLEYELVPLLRGWESVLPKIEV